MSHFQNLCLGLLTNDCTKFVQNSNFVFILGTLTIVKKELEWKAIELKSSVINRVEEQRDQKLFILETPYSKRVLRFQ